MERGVHVWPVRRGAFTLSSVAEGGQKASWQRLGELVRSIRVCVQPTTLRRQMHFLQKFGVSGVVAQSSQ
jgi:hypothetical protein